MGLIRKLLLAGGLAIALTVAGIGGAASVRPALAHDPPAAVEDTPFASPQGTENGLPHFLDALEHSQNTNALVRNPTCSAHFGPDGIHPPGNP
jgi:hypothetical protein